MGQVNIAAVVGGHYGYEALQVGQQTAQAVVGVDYIGALGADKAP